MSSPLPNGTVTFLFTDIEGSTRLWESNVAAMRPALSRHDELLRQSIEANGGSVFKTMGDAFCAVFNTAHEALAAALDGQLALASEAWQTDQPLRARMALHTGVAEERGGDYYGQPLNRVARLLAAGHGGQTLISAAAQELIRDDLSSGCSLLDLGDASLKDLARPERVYQLQHERLLSEFPPLRTLNSHELSNNLPQQSTSFIGREKEIADIGALLQQKRLLTLVGAGGAGKTRLALQAAADLIDGEGDGVWLVELAPLADPGLVAQEVAQVLGVKEVGGQSVPKTLADALKAKALLILLDNCEHLIHACADLAADLLKNCPGVHILATSREPLGVVGEQVYRIPSLSVPASAANNQSVTADSLSQYDSVRLFLERAKAAQPTFVISDTNAPAVAQICTHLDGIPLAIELAAARVRSMPVEQVNTRLDHRFRLLTGGARTLLPRQQTLQALIDWSYDLLSGQEKTMLARLSVFAGGWTLEAAEQVCSGASSGIEDWEALDLLTNLTDKSLAVYEEGQSRTGGSDGGGGGGAAGSARYRLLESIRQYAQERLRESGENLSEAVLRRHCVWCLSLAEEAAPKLAGPDSAQWLNRLDEEHDNLRAALAWRASQPDEAQQSLLLAEALWRFWHIRGHWSEGRQWLDQALERAVGLDTPDDLLLRAKGLSMAGILAFEQGARDTARANIAKSLEIYRGLGNQPGMAVSLNSSGNVAYSQGDFAAARDLYRESLELWRGLEVPSGTASSLLNLGVVNRDLGDYTAARALLQEGLAIQRRLENPSGIALALSNLGFVAWGQGDYAAAHAVQMESLEIRRGLGDQLGTALPLNGLGIVALSRSDTTAARELFQESLDIKIKLGDQLGVSELLVNLGSVALADGDHATAGTLILKSITMTHELGSKVGLADSLECMGDLSASQSSFEHAARCWGASAMLRTQIGASTPPGEQHKLDGKLAAARAEIGDTAFDAAWASGQIMTMDEAAAYALSDTTEEFALPFLNK